MSHGRLHLSVRWYRRRAPLSHFYNRNFLSGSVKCCATALPSWRWANNVENDSLTLEERARPKRRHGRSLSKASTGGQPQQKWTEASRNNRLRAVAPPPQTPEETGATPKAMERDPRRSDSSPTKPSSTSSLLRNWLIQLQSPPNLLTLSRIAATPLLSYWVVTHQTVPAIVGCCIAAASDAADGFLARNCNMATTLGTYLDPLADKLLINALAISLWVNGTLPTPLIGVWLAKDVALMVATYWYVAQRTSEGLTVWDPVTVPLQVNPTTISKVNTGLQFLTLALGIAYPVVVDAAAVAITTDTTTSWLLATLSGPTLPALCWLTGATTILSVGSYIVGRSAFTDVRR